MREPFDDATKAFYRSLFLSWGFTVETEREVFFRGRAIDEFFRQTPEATEKLPVFQEWMQEVLAERERQAEQRGERRGEQRGEQRAQQQTAHSSTQSQVL